MTTDDSASEVRKTVRRIKANSRFDLHKESFLPYWNKAESLRSGAVVIWHAYNGTDTSISPQSLGFGEGFSFHVSLPPIFYFLTGLSIEVLLKAICRAHNKPPNDIHRLVDLSESAGIPLGDNDKIILRALTEYVYWAGRYPTPKNQKEWDCAHSIFDRQHKCSGKLSEYAIKERSIDLENYDRIWGILSECFWGKYENTVESISLGFD